jgi:DNA topoisomerase I
MNAPALLHVSDTMPGITRQRQGKAFAYRLPDGSLLRDEATLARIRALAIPPAYRDVWICPLPEGHLQATGRDARGRKQYRYHPEYRALREDHKFDRLRAFGVALPRVRQRVARDLRQPPGREVTRESVLAAVVRLLDATMLRVGNEQYARDNGSFGLTTLRNGHARVRDEQVRFSFRGKSGVPHDVALSDPRVARVVRRCQALPGHTLFAYVDAEGHPHPIASHDVNDYLRDISGCEISAKDFRTWHGSVSALALAGQRRAREVLAEVAARLRNTLAVCRKAYVHPRVLALLQGEPWPERMRVRRCRGLRNDECRLLALLDASRATAKGRG